MTTETYIRELDLFGWAVKSATGGYIVVCNDQDEDREPGTHVFTTIDEVCAFLKMDMEQTERNWCSANGVDIGVLKEKGG